MKSAFAHFDEAHRENFCAAVMLLLMEVEPQAKTALITLVLSKLGIVDECALDALGREARLATEDDEPFARVDIWLRFMSATPFYVFVELKTHDRWDARNVGAQVRDQASRRSVAKDVRQIRGSLLLAPTRLCLRVRERAPDIRSLSWTELLNALKPLAPDSKLTQHCISHLEENVERPIGISGRSLHGFEDATTTVACLRMFLLGCISDIGGSSTKKLNTTLGDGEPLRRNGWAWHGVSVPFSVNNLKHYVGIYKYVETPRGSEAYLETLWLELQRSRRRRGQSRASVHPDNTFFQRTGRDTTDLRCKVARKRYGEASVMVGLRRSLSRAAHGEHA